MNTGGFVKTSLIVVLALGLFVGIGSLAVRDRSGAKITVNEQLLAEVIQGEFISSVIETGDVDSSKNVEIRCKVKTQGRAGTAILDIVPEGSVVAKGDYLAQLDDSLLVDQVTEQKILEAEDKAAVIQAQSDLDTATRVLEEYKNGTYEQERATLEAEKALAEEMLRRAGDYRNYSENLNRKGYIAKGQGGKGPESRRPKAGDVREVHARSNDLRILRGNRETARQSRRGEIQAGTQPVSAQGFAATSRRMSDHRPDRRHRRVRQRTRSR
jgi:multidrug efflux pump subunit AcrA (membrane-fusion protein)